MNLRLLILLLSSILATTFATPAPVRAQDEPESVEAESRPAADEGEAEEATEADGEGDDDDRPVAYVGADVYVGTGSLIRRGTVVTKGKKIESVGAAEDVEIPEGAEVVDVTGKVLCPGFVMVKASGFGAPSTFRLESIADELNPFDPETHLGLAVGITSFGMLTAGGRELPAGKSAVIKLAPGDLDGMLLEAGGVVSMKVPLDPKQWKKLRETIEKVEEYKKELAEYEAEQKKAAAEQAKAAKGGADKKAEEGAEKPAKPAKKAPKKKAPKPPRGGEDLMAVMDGKKVLWIESRFGGRRSFFGGGGSGMDNRQIRQALDVARMLGVGVVLDRPTSGWTMASEIAAVNGSMAILSPRSRVEPDEGNPEETGSNLASASILTEAGVPIAVSAPQTSLSLVGLLGQDLNTPTLDAAFCVRGGLDNRKALRAITLDAARILGVADRVGSIEAGKDADILILDGDPLHYATLVDRTVVNGETVYERAKEPYYSHIKR